MQRDNVNQFIGTADVDLNHIDPNTRGNSQFPTASIVNNAAVLEKFIAQKSGAPLLLSLQLIYLTGASTSLTQMTNTCM